MRKNVLRRLSEAAGWAYIDASKEYPYAFKLLPNGDIIRAVSVETADRVEIRIYDDDRRFFRKEEDFNFPYASISITHCYIGYVIPGTVSELVSRETEKLMKFIKDNQEEIVGITKFKVIDTKPIRKEVKKKAKIKAANDTANVTVVENDITEKPTTFSKFKKGLKDMSPWLVAAAITAVNIYQKRRDDKNKK